MTPPSAPARLDLWDDRFLWASRSFQGGMTRRYATNVIVAIGPRPFLLRRPGQAPRPCAAAVCAAGAPRSVDATDVPFLSLNLDPGTAAARALEGLLAGQSVLSVERARLSPCDAAMAALLHGQLDGAQARALGEELVRALSGQAPRAVAIDPRVREIADCLRTQLPPDLQVAPLARRVALSPMRLMHLFSAQIGLPMSRFLLWQKMRRAVSLIQSGQSMTEIAHRCGFADASHLTHTFQAFYAVKPSSLSDSSYVQVRLC